MSANYLTRDAALRGTRALPSAASATVDGAAVDIGLVSNSLGATFLPGHAFFLLTYPLLSATQLPDGATVTFSILESANADLSSPTVKYPNIVVQTGAALLAQPAARLSPGPRTTRNNTPATRRDTIGTSACA